MRSALTFSCVAAFLALGSWATYWGDYRNDQYQLINLGSCVYSGGRMYVDCWENKPPGMAWINAAGLAITGGDQFGAWILPGVVGAIAIVVFWLLLARVVSVQAARRGAIIAALIASTRLYDAPSINPDFYSFSFELIAASLFVGSFSAASRWTCTALGTAAGLAWAAATGVKQVGCVGLIAVGIVALVAPAVERLRRRSAGTDTATAPSDTLRQDTLEPVRARNGMSARWIRATGAAIVGFAAGVAAIAAILAFNGTLAEAWHAIGPFNARYLPAAPADTAMYSWPRLRAELGLLALPLWLGLLATIGTLRFGGERVSRPFVWAMLLWFLAAVPFALTGPSMAMRYWQSVWPPMLWLAAIGLDLLNDLYRKVEGRARLAAAVVLITVLVLLLRPFAFEYRHWLAEAYLSYSEHPNERERLADMGRRLAELVPAGERIYVWSYDVGPYVHAQRLPASRFTYPRSHEQMAEIFRVLEGGKAYAILVTPKPGPQFARLCDSACEGRLQAILEGYTKAEDIGRYAVWIRPAAPGGG